LEEVGVPFRLGAVVHTTELIPDDYLIQASEVVGTVSRQPALPRGVGIQADLIIAMTNVQFISFGACPRSSLIEPVVVGIALVPRNLLRANNVARNIIAHEIGHSIGLGHNNDPSTLMCGRPTSCTPTRFESDEETYYPLNEQDKLRLRSLYNPMWWPPTSR
jgi:hypothetical protein